MSSRPGITLESLKLKLASPGGPEELLRARGDNALSIANLLDQILSESGLHEKRRRTCSVTLQKLCGACCILPNSHTITDGLKITSDGPVAYGGFANVYRGSYNGRAVAIKALKLSHANKDDLTRSKKPFCKEAAGWKYLNHPNVLHFFGATTVKLNSFSLISPWMENGNINQYIRSRPQVNRMELLAQVANGVEYLHSLDVVHGDLKGGNILISDDNHALLADFGLMTIALDSIGASYTETSASINGTTRWMSPELFSPEDFGLSSSKPTKCSDVYALGMVILEVLTGAKPFDEIKREESVLFTVMNGKKPTRPLDSANLGISDQMWNLLQRCWSAKSDERPTARIVRELLREATPSWIAPVSPQKFQGVNNETSSVSSSGTLKYPSFNDHLEVGPEVRSGSASQAIPSLVDVSEAVTIPVPTPRKSRRNGESGGAIKGTKSSPKNTRTPPKTNIGRMHEVKDLKSLLQLGDQVRQKFDEEGNIEDLDQAIALHLECLDLCPPGNPCRVQALNDLGRGLERRFGSSGDKKDLEQAIKLHRECLELCPPGNPHRAQALNSLGWDFGRRFGRGGDKEDLEQAIALHRECLDLRPPGTPHRAQALNGLGWDLGRRFERNGDKEDLEQAIKLHRECLDLRPPGNAHRAQALNNLGWDLGRRSRSSGNIEDLEEAIKLHRECLELRPRKNSQRAQALNSLGWDFGRRFGSSGDIEDLEQAIELRRECLVLRPPGNPYRAQAFNDLSRDLGRRFMSRGGIEDLDQAIELLRSALQVQVGLLHSANEWRCEGLQRLGQYLGRRFDRQGKMQDLDEAIALHRSSPDFCPHHAQHPQVSAALESLVRKRSKHMRKHNAVSE